MLRPPVPPGRVVENAAKAAAGSTKIFGPSGPLVVLTPGTALMAVAFPVNSQLVGNWKPLPIAVGSPEVQRQIPESCQPPTIALAQPGALDANFLPLPIGSSAMPLKLMLWVTSKSDTAFRNHGFQALSTEPANRPLRSTTEAQSWDFDSV